MGLAGAASSAPMVRFLAGTIPVAIDCPGAMTPCTESTNATLTVDVDTTSAVANFTVSELVPGPRPTTLIETFTLPSYLAPTGIEPGGSPYFSGPNLTNASWDTSAATGYRYVTFWSNVDGGGISIGSAPDDTGASLLALFESEQSVAEGSPSPFTLTGVPEPTTWAMLIVGACAAGANLRRRRATGA